jgi:hypothetical protein
MQLYNHLPPPPRPPQWCAQDVERISDHLTKKHNARKWQVEYLLAMLNENYTVSLPRLKRVRSDLTERSPQRLRWLWYSWATKILGWKRRRCEGHAQGFSAEVYKTLREHIFPFPKIEREDNISSTLSPSARAVQREGGVASTLADGAYMTTVGAGANFPDGRRVLQHANLAEPDTEHELRRQPSSSGARQRSRCLRCMHKAEHINVRRGNRDAKESDSEGQGTTSQIWGTQI